MCFLPQDEEARDVRRRAARALHQGRGPEAGRLARRADRHDRPRQGGARAHAGDPPGDRRPRRQARRPGRLRAQDPGDPQADPEPAGRSRRRSTSCPACRSSTCRPSRRAPWSTRACCSRHQVGSFYEDLRNPLTESALGLVHQRFSTNTFPSWKLAHPYRFIAHNGEINTVRGNVNWMNARRRTMESDLLGADLDKMWPIIPHGQSDTACLDNALELLVAGGYSLAHAMMMLIPEAWAGNPLMDAEAQGLLRISRRADGAVGRPGRDRLHRRPPDRRHARPQRPAARRASWSPTTTWSSWPRKRACCRSPRRRSCASGACSPARCC